MTALFMARMPDGIVAAADGAFYDHEGKLAGIATKLILMPAHDCIISLQGPYFFHPELRIRLHQVQGGFDGILNLIVETMRAIHGDYANEYGFSRAFALLIGGYSATRGRWETYWINSEPYEEGSEHEPYEAWELTLAFATVWVPGYGREAALSAGLDPEKPLNAQGLAPAEIGIRVVTAGRFQPIPIHGDAENGCCQVDGFIQVAHLCRGEAQTAIVHRWPDVIGERMRPDGRDETCSLTD